MKYRFFYTGIAAFNVVVSAFYHGAAARPMDFENPANSPEIRIADLLSRMTPLEKISQLGNNAPGLPRLGLAAYAYWNEALHGVMAEGVTVFPQAIALSSTWDTLLEYKIACAISDEARALSAQTGRGLTYFSPTANMARDPRWGRTEETYGEDVFLAKKFIVNFIRGMQGDDPQYLKTVATVKHFACNNVEKYRMGTSAQVDERSLREYYLPVFKAAVTEGRVASVMAAFNAINGIPCCANGGLLIDILRKEWGFSGYVVSDCEAIDYLCRYHHYAASYQDAAAIALRAGCDLCCGLTYQQYLPLALINRLWFLSQADIDTALARVLITRTRLGAFDPASMVPYSSISPSIINCQSHQDLALQAAREALVLLKNEGAILPLNTSTLTSVAVIGPSADVCQLGGYSGTPVVRVSALDGIRKRMGDVGGNKVKFVRGCSISGPRNNAAFDSAVSVARAADVAVMFMGTDNAYVHEDVDLDSLSLPGAQSELVKAVLSANPRTIVVLMNGNPLSIDWAKQNVPGIIEAWYGGQAQGTAVAEALFGDYNPGGKLTSTWVSSPRDLPDMNDYSIFNGRTYLFFTGKPLYPFGYGLSYTTFAISNLQMLRGAIGPGDTARLSVDVKNTGGREGDEVVQLYIHDRGLTAKKPLKQLKGFQRVHLDTGETATVTFGVAYEELAFWDAAAHAFRVDGGTYDLVVGNSSIDTAVFGQITSSAAPKLLMDGKPAGKNFSLTRLARDRFQFRFSGDGPYTAAVFTTNGRLIFSLKNRGAGSWRWKAPSPGVYVIKVSGPNYGSILTVCAPE